MRSWWINPQSLLARLRSQRAGLNATADFYFLNAVGDLIAAAGRRSMNRPIRQIGPFSFAAGQRLVVIRYATEQDLSGIRARQWSHVHYVIDDLILTAAESPDLPIDYRRRLQAFTNGPLRKILALAPVVIAPSEAILEEFKASKGLLVDPVLPAALEPEKRTLHHRHAGPLRICFLGTRSHQSSLGLLAGIADSLSHAAPGARITLFFGEHLPPPLRNHPAIDNRKPLSWPRYKQLVAAERFHIALAPLIPTPFNRGRSITKLLDTATVGAAGLYSDEPPFRGRIRSGVSGLLLANKPEDWLSAIAALADDRDRCHSLARQGVELANALGDRNVLRRFWTERLDLVDRI